VPGLEWVFGAFLVPLLCLAVCRWACVIRDRKEEERLMGQTIAYLHKAASESGQDVNSGRTTRTAGFTDYNAMLDGLAPCPPNGDLVAYDALLHERTARSITNLFTAFASTFLRPVVGPMTQWFEQTPDSPDRPSAVAAPAVQQG